MTGRVPSFEELRAEAFLRRQQRRSRRRLEAAAARGEVVKYRVKAHYRDGREGEWRDRAVTAKKLLANHDGVLGYERAGNLPAAWPDRAAEAGAAAAAEALRHFDETGNPIFAAEALTSWPADEPLPDLLRQYLARAFGAIAAAARDPSVPADGAAEIVARALGSVGGRGRGSGAVADYREGRAAAAARARAGFDDGSFVLPGPDDAAAALAAVDGKHEEAHAKAAERLGISVARFRRLLTECRRFRSTPRRDSRRAQK